MAHNKTSLMDWRGMLLPDIKWRIGQCPGLSVEIYASHTLDALLVMVSHESRSYQMLLLTRWEMEGNIPHTIAGSRLDDAIAEVLPSRLPDVSEYDDIMQGQVIMDDLNG